MQLPHTLSADFLRELAALQTQVQVGADASQTASTVVALTAGGLAVGSLALAAHTGLFSTLLIPASAPWQTLDPGAYLNTRSTPFRIRLRNKG